MKTAAHARALRALNMGDIQPIPAIAGRVVPTRATGIIAATIPKAPRDESDRKNLQNASSIPLPAWPVGAPQILKNGQPIDPNDYKDDDEFVLDYRRFVALFTRSVAIHADATLAKQRGDTIAYSNLAHDSANALVGAQRYLQAASIRVANDSVDPGRWIVQHDPIAAFVKDIADGKPIDQAFRDAGDAVANNVKDVGPYIQTVCSFIPGFGTAAAACIGAAVAIAKGEDIGDGLIDTIGGCLPGGVVTQMAFRAGVTAIKDACEGKTWQQVAWDSAREAMPPGPCRMAFDAATAVAGAAIAQADPAAAQAIFTGATQNNATNIDAPPPKLPSARQILDLSNSAEAAYMKRALPPAPPWTPAPGTPMPPTASRATPLLALFAGAAALGWRFL